LRLARKVPVQSEAILETNILNSLSLEELIHPT
jgi:hypothetical protein